MKRTKKIRLPKGLMTGINLLEDGSYEIAIEAEEETTEGFYVLVEASRLSEVDKFMEHVPQTDREKEFKELLVKAIRSDIKDFYRPKFDPAFYEEGKICFEPDMEPATGKSYYWWDKTAKAFDPKCNSRLGTKFEYVAFLGVLIKVLVNNGLSVAEAWNAVCNDSKELGHYANSKDSKGDFERTGSREICGFCDLANTCKILAGDKGSGFWFGGGSWDHKVKDTYFSLASLSHSDNLMTNYYSSVGWIVFEKNLAMKQTIVKLPAGKITGIKLLDNGTYEVKLRPSIIE